jgi:hypothetical protein
MKSDATSEQVPQDRHQEMAALLGGSAQPLTSFRIGYPTTAPSPSPRCPIGSVTVQAG